MPVAVALGGLPETVFSATVPLPTWINELALAGFLRRMPLEVASVCSGTLLVPTSADVVIEGEIFPGESAKEGPFGNHTGLYADQKDAPVLHVRRILRRHDAVIPATIVGPPPMEDCLFVRGWERLLLPWLRLHVPAVREIHFILAAAFHRAAVVVADATVTAEELVAQLRQTEPLKGSKLLVVVDPDVRPDAYEEVFWRVVNALPDGLAGSSIHDGAGIAVDARSRGKERVVRDAQTVSKVTRRWSEYGLDY